MCTALRHHLRCECRMSRSSVRMFDGSNVLRWRVQDASLRSALRHHLRRQRRVSRSNVQLSNGIQLHQRGMHDVQRRSVRSLYRRFFVLLNADWPSNFLHDARLGTHVLRAALHDQC